jgi:hypothetical protein
MALAGATATVHAPQCPARPCRNGECEDNPLDGTFRCICAGEQRFCQLSGACLSVVQPFLGCVLVAMHRLRRPCVRGASQRSPLERRALQRAGQRHRRGAEAAAAAAGHPHAAHHRRDVSRACPSCTRSILTEIYLCHACSCHETLPSWNRSILTEIYLCHACSDHGSEDGNARAGGRWWG